MPAGLDAAVKHGDQNFTSVPDTKFAGRETEWCHTRRQIVFIWRLIYREPHKNDVFFIPKCPTP